MRCVDDVRVDVERRLNARVCLECEQRIGRFETEFCERICLPLHERRQDRFRYGLAFVQFAVSVLWRALVLLRVEGRLGRLGELGEIVSTERVWREFLLGKIGSVAPHDVHAFHMDAPPPDATLRDLPSNWAATCFGQLVSSRFSGMTSAIFSSRSLASTCSARSWPGVKGSCGRLPGTLPANTRGQSRERSSLPQQQRRSSR